MTGSRSIPFLLILFCYPLLLMAQPKEKIDWIYEIDLLEKELAKKHKNLYFKTDSLHFHEVFTRIAEGAEDQSLFQVSIQLQQALALMCDAHTRINYHFNIDADAILPVQLYWFDDGIFVLKARREFQEILGKKLTAVNGFGMDRIIDSLSTLIPVDNPSMVKAELPRMLAWTQLLEHFGFGERSSIRLEVEDADGTRKEISVQLPAKESSPVRIQPDIIALGWQDQKAFFWASYLAEDKIYYIQYNKCWSRETEEEYGTGTSALFMPSFKEFEKQVSQSIRKEEIDKLVFDMRFNGGGNSNQGSRFIRKLCKTKFNGRGKFYVLVGRHTFSSAIINTVDFMKNSDVVIVGEETGGRSNHYGEVKRFVLPESKLIVSYSTKFFSLLDEEHPLIIPDLKTSLTFADFMKGVDPAMVAVRNHETN